MIFHHEYKSSIKEGDSWLVPVYQTTRRHIIDDSSLQLCSSFYVSSVLVLSDLFYQFAINSFDHGAWNLPTILFFLI
jgi:hypothetical protein